MALLERCTGLKELHLSINVLQPGAHAKHVHILQRVVVQRQIGQGSHGCDAGKVRDLVARRVQFRQPGVVADGQQRSQGVVGNIQHLHIAQP